MTNKAATITSSTAQKSWIVGFEDRYSRAQRDRKEAAARKQLRKKNTDRLTPSRIDLPVERKQVRTTPKAQKNPSAKKTVRIYSDYAVGLREERRLVKERLENGYSLTWAREIAGKVRSNIHEDGLRSEDNSILKLFVSRIPKGGKARASDDKANLYVPYMSKLLTLDCPYIEANKTFLGAIRLDCDAVFASPDGCLNALRELVKQESIPHLPHIITGDLMPDGTYRNPHFIFMLPYGKAVWNNFEDERCRAQPVRLFDGVSRGLCRATLGIGVDPAAPRVTMRMKNPLSPIWHTMTPNTSEFLTLSEYARCVDTRSSFDDLVRHAAVVQSGMGIKPSNIAFNVLHDRAKVILRQWHFNADPRIAGTRERLADHLYIELSAHAKDTGLSDVGVSAVVGKVSEYMATEFDPKRLEKTGKARHRLMHVVDGLEGLAARQKIGAEHSAATRKSKTMEKLLAAYSAALDRGEHVSVERLASLARVSRSAAYRSFEACQQICLARSIVKKVGTTTEVSE
ncbi:hypothetical protein ELH70_14520 [Rhizobium ruizarguesonis]|uniref:hypothetical protein n=1 Tax=Rhizobium ruizarguesonis TaxID=2081791 RepID=UPI0010325DB4|nr:hypothetical protein [Rhizobium ruizarguesonis]TAZ73786.1 hypothetical protein ELH70_14520 [Rhizobium ruizarguesonis]TAZ86767.1 hypothetical protein ELH69_37755 [Rhizobium ruizarguesonis]